MAEGRGQPLKTNFTVQGLTKLQPPATGRLYIYDARTPALALCITANNTRTFYLYRRVHGKPQRVRLGRFPQMTIEKARDAAMRTHADVADGVDPNATKRKARQQPTLGEAFEDYKAKWLTPRATVKTLATDESRFAVCLAPWRDRKLTSITRDDVRAFHAEWGKQGKRTTANRAVQLLRRIFNFAAKSMTDLANPAQGIDLFREQARERFLAADEMPRFFAALEVEEDETFRDFFAMALWTGARRGNVQAMRWAHVNLASATWAIPADEFKTGKPMNVALSPEALAILVRRQETIINEFVFPGRGKTGHLVEPKTAWERLRQRAGLPGLRIHDLRRTLGSWQAAQGTSLPIIGKSLGHTRAETTAIYSRLNLDPVRTSVNSATAAMVAAGKAVANGKA